MIAIFNLLGLGVPPLAGMARPLECSGRLRLTAAESAGFLLTESQTTVTSYLVISYWLFANCDNRVAAPPEETYFGS